jgi:radical SAM protein with 4Fe4S-binding SPASM domain
MSLPAAERARWGDPDLRLNLATVTELLDEGAAKGQAAVGLNGMCEPLLSPDLPEIVAYARSKGMVDVMFNTNGLLLDADISRRLIRAGLTRIMISLDASTEETYRKIRAGSNFERVTENVRSFIRLRRELGRALPVVRVSFCLTSLNEHELEDFIRTWSDLADFFSIQQYGNTFAGEHAQEGSRLFPERHRYEPANHQRCAQPWKRVMVRHNGEVIPCCDASGLNLVIGNIYHHCLEDIWLGGPAEAIRSLHKRGRYARHPICRACMTKWGPPQTAEAGRPGGL